MNCVRVGKIQYSESVKKSDKNTTLQSYRRPFAVGVQCLNDMALTDSILEAEEKEFNIKVFILLCTCAATVFFYTLI